MDVRIGVVQTPKEIEVEMDDSTDREALKQKIDDALAGEDGVLWLTDKRGNDVAVAVSRIGYVEVGHPAATRSMGFSA